MKRSIYALFVVAVGVQACGRPGGRPEPEIVTRASYQPFAASYRGVGYSQTTQYFDDQPTTTAFGLEYFVSAEVAGAEGGLTAMLVLDSVLLFDRATGGITPTQIDSARGATYHARMADDGHLYDYSGGEAAGMLARELSDRVLQQFFPTIPSGGAEPGATWADTGRTLLVANGIENDVSFSSQHSATEWTVHAGVRSLCIITVSSYEFRGSGSQSGRAFTIEGHGRRHLHRYLSETGRYVGLISADTSDAEARIAETDMVIPIHQTRADSLLIR